MTSGTAGKVLAALEAYQLQKVGANEYRANSPLRPSSNSHAFTLKIEDEEHGAYFDHVTDEAGSLYQLAQALHIDLPQIAPAMQTKRAYADLAEYAQLHGVDETVFTAAGWHVEMVDNRRALIYPTAGGERVRFIDGKEGSAYRWRKAGGVPCWYGLKRAIELARKSGATAPIVLVNGEASTVVCQHYDVPAACTTGGEGRLKEELLAELNREWAGEVLIAFDCDETGRKAALAVAAQIGSRARLVDLALEDKGDAADFCRLWEHGTYEELQRRAVAAPKLETPTETAGLTELAQSLGALTNLLRVEEKAARQKDIEALVSQAQAHLDRVSLNTSSASLVSLSALGDLTERFIDERRVSGNALIGLQTKLPTLDKQVGGFQPELYTVYAATGMGKTTFTVCVAREWMQQAPGLVITTESIPMRWMMKLVASMTHITSDKIERGDLSDVQAKQVKDALARIKQFRCDVMDVTQPTVNAVRGAVLTGVQRHGYGWCIIDSMSKMKHPGAGAIFDETRAVWNGIQSLMLDARIPFLVTSQISRAIEGRVQKIPRLADGYGGAVIEQNSAYVFSLYHHDYYVKRKLSEYDPKYTPQLVELYTLKERWGGGHEATPVRLRFEGGIGFWEMDTHHDAG